MNVTDRVCDLECMKEGTIHEFVGPVKIVLVDPPEDQYNRRKSGAAFVGIANIFMGANNIIVILFTLGFKLPKYMNAHIILCTIGYQFCMPLAILMLHSLHGPAAPLKKSQRRREHFLLHLLGLVCSFGGSIVAWIYGEPSVIQPDIDKTTTYHFYAGCATAVVAIFTILLGPLLFLVRGELVSPTFLTAAHRFLGMLTFFLSSICFILGMLKPSMQIFLFIIGYVAPTFLILFFTVFYTLVVIATPATKFAKKTT